MPFYHGVMVCHIIFRGAMKRTFYTVLSVRKRCSLLHRKDMRQSMPIFASPMVEIREILCVWKRKVIRQTTRLGPLGEFLVIQLPIRLNRTHHMPALTATAFQ